MLASVVVDGPLTGSADAVTQSFDAKGNLTSVSNSLGHTTTYASYNALGQPGRVTGPNGDITDYTYDARGRASTEKRFVNSAWQTTTYKYNAAGLLESITRPDGQKRTYVYDAARRLMREYEPESATTFAQKRYTYNDMSLVTRVDTERTTTPLAAPALSVSSTTSSTGSYSVSWGTVADTTSYRLYEKVGSGSWTQIVSANVTTKAISGKTNGTYSYYVEACNSAGCGPNSATVSVVVSLSGPPAVPTMTAPPLNNYGGNYSAAWNSVPGATSYRLEENGLEVYNGTATSRSFSKMASGTFSYRVRACNTAGCSAYSPIRTVNVEVEHCPSCFAAPSPPAGSSEEPANQEGGQ
jgi:YD repeat-containing protein